MQWKKQKGKKEEISAKEDRNLQTQEAMKQLKYATYIYEM